MSGQVKRHYAAQRKARKRKGWFSSRGRSKSFFSVLFGSRRRKLFGIF